MRSLLVLLVVALAVPASDAASLRLRCRRRCGAAITACVQTTHDTRRHCRRDVLERCREAGIDVCPRPTTTTIPAGPCDFDSSSRRCTGRCGNGGHCSAVASGGACECRKTSCGDADAPECNGFCARDEACLFTLTGCSCVGIP